MTKSTDREDFSSRLWSGAERTAQPAEGTVVPLTRPATPPNREYVAFEVREGTDRLHIHRATQPSRYPGYHYLLDIVFDHDFGSMFTLIYSFMVVEVTGKNLEPVVHAISYGNCARIHEFHRNHYDSPPQGDPLIEKIVIVAGENPSSSGA